VDLLASPEQREIIDVVAGFLADRFPTSRLRERAGEPTSFEPATWSECGELGWFALGLPEELGGVGYGMIEEALVFRELGRYLAPGPFVATSLGARVAAMSGSSQLAASIAAGASPVALAAPRSGEPIEIGDTVAGSFHVIDGPGATYYLVVTDTDAALVVAGATGPLGPVPSIDEGARLARLAIDGAPAVAHLSGTAGPELWLRGTVLVSAMLTGVAAATQVAVSIVTAVLDDFARAAVTA